MCKPMTDERLDQIEAEWDATQPPRGVIYQFDVSHPVANFVEKLPNIIPPLLAEVRRLRAEAIEWHPYPSKLPPQSKQYLVTLVHGGHRVRSVYKAYWHSLRMGWSQPDTSIQRGVIAWAEVPEPWEGD